MGLFDSLGGALGTVPGGTGYSAGGPKKSGGAILFLNALMPSILQAFAGAQAGGMNLEDFFSPYMSKKKGKGAFSAKVGKGQFLDVSALSEALPGLLEKAQSSQIGMFNQTVDKLSQVPAFKGIFDEASGNFSQEFTGQVNAGYEGMANSLLGQGAVGGFLSDSNKQAQILGPLALQKAEYLKNIQKAAEAQKLGLAGAGGLSGSNPGSLLGASPQGAYGQGIFAGAGLYGNNAQFNAGQGFKSAFGQAQASLDTWNKFLQSASQAQGNPYA